jgi:hypothetical protein
MSAADDSRPYRDHSEAEILEQIRRLQNDFPRYRKRYNTAYKLGDNAGMDGEQMNMDALGIQIGRYQNELKIRREERAARRNEPGHRNAPREAGHNLVAVACGCRPPRRFKLPGRVYDIGPITCGNCSQPFKLT